MLQGTYTALVTPFRNGEIDFQAFKEIIEWQIENGIDGLVVCGSTGESITLSFKEQSELLSFAVEVVNGRVPVIGGIGVVATEQAIQLGRNAIDAGVDALLVLVPYYIKPTQEQIYKFYYDVSSALNFPIILYNNPGRCGVSMSVDTVVRLSQDSNFIGIKEADSDITRPTQYRNFIDREDFSILSGNSSTVAAFLAQGGHGVISTTSNVEPALCARLTDAWIHMEMDDFQEIRDILLPLDEALYFEPVPASIKYVLSESGLLCSPEVRPPLQELSPETKERLMNVVRQFDEVGGEDDEG